jgi:hypothetical protein
VTFDHAKYESDSWGKPSDYKTPFDHQVPSGKTVLVRRLDMTDILKLGMIEDLDFMAKALVVAENKGEEKQSDADENSILLKAIGNANNFAKMEKLINAIVVEGVIAPKLHHPPEHEAARQAGLRYVDSVPFDDRVDLFGTIFDSEGLSTFRPEQKPSVADVPNVTDVPLPTE